MPDETEVVIIIEPAIVGLDGVLLTKPAQYRDARNRSKSTRFRIAIPPIGPQATVGTASGVLSDVCESIRKRATGPFDRQPANGTFGVSSHRSAIATAKP